MGEILCRFDNHPQLTPMTSRNAKRRPSTGPHRLKSPAEETFTAWTWRSGLAGTVGHDATPHSVWPNSIRE